MEYLADTVTVIRHFSKTGKLGSKARVALEETEKGRHHIFISVVSLVEIMYLAQKLRIGINLTETLELIGKSTNYSIIDLNQNIVILAEATKVPELFDRLILATAEYLGVPIITSDEEIRKQRDVPVIW